MVRWAAAECSETYIKSRAIAAQKLFADICDDIALVTLAMRVISGIINDSLRLTLQIELAYACGGHPQPMSAPEDLMVSPVYWGHQEDDE